MCRSQLSPLLRSNAHCAHLLTMAGCYRCSSSTAAVQDTAAHSSLARQTYHQAQEGKAAKSVLPSGSSTTSSSRVSQSWDAWANLLNLLPICCNSNKQCLAFRMVEHTGLSAQNEAAVKVSSTAKPTDSEGRRFVQMGAVTDCLDMKLTVAQATLDVFVVLLLAGS